MNLRKIAPNWFSRGKNDCDVEATMKRPNRMFCKYSLQYPDSGTRFMFIDSWKKSIFAAHSWSYSQVNTTKNCLGVRPVFTYSSWKHPSQHMHIAPRRPVCYRRVVNTDWVYRICVGFLRAFLSEIASPRRQMMLIANLWMCEKSEQTKLIQCLQSYNNKFEVKVTECSSTMENFDHRQRAEMSEILYFVISQLSISYGGINTRFHSRRSQIAWNSNDAIFEYCFAVEPRVEGISQHLYLGSRTPAYTLYRRNEDNNDVPNFHSIYIKRNFADE